jgi:hypothetical protein
VRTKRGRAAPVHNLGPAVPIKSSQEIATTSRAALTTGLVVLADDRAFLVPCAFASASAASSSRSARESSSSSRTAPPFRRSAEPLVLELGGRTRRKLPPTATPCEPYSGTPSGPGANLPDRLALDEVLAPNPCNRLHNQHPLNTLASNKSQKPATAKPQGSFFGRSLECAPDGGQDHAAFLTVCRA